jgi:hypothetical protein
MCGSERIAPEWSKQRFPAVTPHVGQGTEENCSGVRSFILTGTGCDKLFVRAAPFGTRSGNRSDESGDRTSSSEAAISLQPSRRRYVLTSSEEEDSACS